MTGTGTARGGLGWVILVVALAVPGVLFYNWWSHLKAEREKSVAAKARGRVPDGGVFQSSPNAKLVNPMTPAVSTDTAAAAIAASSAVSSGAVSAAPAAAPAPAEEPAAAAAAASEAAPAPVAASTTTLTAALPLKRDPTLSPFDQIRLLQEEDARRRAAEDLENMKKGRQQERGPRVAKEKDPRTLVDLQGIISNPESGFKAIVNNEVVGAGEYIGSSRIKVIKISDLGVTFEFKGKRFSKGVSRD